MPSHRALACALLAIFAGACPGSRSGPTRATVAVQVTGAGRVTSIPQGLDCTKGCSASFPADAAVLLRATPEPGSAFFGWTGACSGSGSCLVSGSASVTAQFAATSGLDVVPVATQAAGIRLNPDPMRLFIRQWVKLEARRGGVPEPRVAWSVQEGGAGGSVSADGTYTAPAQAGTWHVTASSLDDPAVLGQIAIQVVVSQDLYDYGGPILAAPKLWLIWRGGAGEFGEAVDLFHRFLGGVNGSAWLAVLDQYMRGDRARVAFAGEIVGSPAPAPGTDPGEEICAALARGHLDPDPGTIYALLLPGATGTFDHHTTALCAGVRVPIVVVALRPAPGPQQGACTQSMTEAERMLWAFSHELAETMTDPEPVTAWADLFDQEVADDCAATTCERLPTGSFSLNPLLSNAAGGCVP